MKKNLCLCCLLLLGWAFAPPRKTTIWLIGDSTMARKKPEREPESGWGEGLKSFVSEKASVHNHAASGRSSRSFVAEKRWQAVLDSIQPGDYVVMQFGHNDEKPDSALHTEPFTTYKQFLKQFIDETRAKAGIPLVCSPIVRRQFAADGSLRNTHGEYVEASQQAAQENKVAFVDMEAKSRALVGELGREKSKSLFVYCQPGECPKRMSGVQDSTHLNQEGARQIAQLFVQAVRAQKLPVSKVLRPASLPRSAWRIW